MTAGPLSRLSLLWKILLSTSIALTLLFTVTGWVVQDQFIRSASQNLEEEVRSSFQAYESLWRARASQLASVSLVLSRMPDVRAAFSTGDQATVSDVAGEIWKEISQHGAIFLVTDPQGLVLASLGGAPGAGERNLEIVPRAAQRFPQQSSGFWAFRGRLYQTVFTPVYVATPRGPALINVLVAGYAVDESLALSLKTATGGSDFVFVAQGQTIASTLAPATVIVPAAAQPVPGALPHVQIGGTEYSEFSTPLLDIAGQPAGELYILRSFETARRRMAALRRNMVLLWLAAFAAGLILTYVLARRILEPVHALDLAAAEIGRGNFEARVEVSGQDEIGRLARTFNDMSRSVQDAQIELIRQERLATISRLSTSIVHDLRNPLASIYGGAEMLVDSDLPPHQVKRLASNIYRSSRRVQELLNDLSDVTRGGSQEAEPCRLREVVEDARQAIAAAADANGVGVSIDLSPDLELPMKRSRIQRVFENLFANAIEAMPGGGSVRVHLKQSEGSVVVSVEDDGPGLSDAVLRRLFQPFVTSGKKNGMGLGLALARQAVLDHGGDLWADTLSKSGARFFIRLPV
jgi:signal transduction histidine kinase